jgi:outer membrane biosynthesis protein TonB
MRTACEDGDRSPCPRKAPLPRRACSAVGQNLTEYALVIALIAVVSVVSINALRDSFRTPYMAHQSPLSQPLSALAITATPEESAEEDVTPEPTATATPTPTPTPEPEPEPSLPDCDSQPGWYWWRYNLDCE